MAIVGENPGFVDADDPSTVSIVADHPAKKLLFEALQAIDRGHIRVALDCIEDAVTAISDHDDVMVTDFCHG